jgi:hypothetical protein
LEHALGASTRTIISPFRNVNELSYTQLEWGDAEVAQLCKVLPFCHSLTELHLYQNRIGDAEMAALATCVRFARGALPQQLRELKLFNKISNEGMRSFSSSLGNGAMGRWHNSIIFTLPATRSGTKGLSPF